MEKVEDKNLINDFTWDEDLEFFDKTVETDEQDVDTSKEKKTEVDDKKETLNEENEKESKEKDVPDDGDKEDDKKDKKSEEEQIPFSDTEDEDDKKENKNEDEFYKTLAKELKEAGVFANVELNDEDEIDEDKFIELQNKEVDARVEEAIASFMDELDEDGKAFLKFKKEGGKTEDFFNSIQQEASLPKGDIEDEDFQKKFLKYYYKKYEGFEDEDINDQLEILEDKGKLDKFAKRFYNKVIDEEKRKKDTLLKQQEEERKIREKRLQEYQESIRNTIKDVDEVKSIPITKKDKADLYNYIVKPTVKVDKNRFIPQFQADLNKLGSDPKTLVLLAKLIKSDFDLSDVEKKLNTKATRKLKEKLEVQKRNKVKTSGGGSTKRSLADFF